MAIPVRIGYFNTGNSIIQSCNCRARGSPYKCPGKEVASGSKEAMAAAYRLLSTQEDSTMSNATRAYEIGEKVICVNNKGFETLLVVGSTYKVTGFMHQYIEIAHEDSNIAFCCVFPEHIGKKTGTSASLPETVEMPRAFDVGDIIICTNDFQWKHTLEKDASYRVVGFSNTLGARFLRIERLDRSQIVFSVPPDMFRLAKPSEAIAAVTNASAEKKTEPKRDYDLEVYKELERYYGHK